MRHPLGELFANCRMVLCLGCGDGALLRDLKTRNVPAAGLDRDPAKVEALRTDGLIAWRGDWRTLATHHRKFDGVHWHIDENEPEEATAMVAAALLPEGKLVVSGNAKRVAESDVTGLERVSQQGSVALLIRARDPAPPCAPGVTVQWSADAFAGCERVLEIEPGAGRFLDALHVRDIPAEGVAADPAALADRAATCTGVYCGNLADALDPQERVRLFAFCANTLAENGRFVVRTHRASNAIAAELESIGCARTHVQPANDVTGDSWVFGLRTDAAVDPVLLADRRKFDIDVGSRAIDLPLASLHDLERFERREFAQGGEDGIIDAIFELIGTTNRRYVEFGCGDGVQCNTAALRRKGWTGTLMDGMAEPTADDAVIHAEWIDRDNINALFAKHGVPPEPDLVSIDLDGNDYWVWQALVSNPRVVVAEYNANQSKDLALVMPYDPRHQWDGTDYYGASLKALASLAHQKGYALVYCNCAGVNAFFVRRDLVPGFSPRPDHDVYRPPNYWYRGYRQTPNLGRAMQSLENSE